MRRFILVLCALVLASCSGDTGPAGPAGPTGATGAIGPVGPQGIPGLDGTSASISFGIVTIDTGGVGVLTATNAQIETSVINCYESDSNTGPWLTVADGFSDTSSFCAASNSGPDLVIILLQGIPGWFFLATVVTVS